jgi:hypothetical protein
VVWGVENESPGLKGSSCPSTFMQRACCETNASKSSCCFFVRDKFVHCMSCLFSFCHIAASAAGTFFAAICVACTTVLHVTYICISKEQCISTILAKGMKMQERFNEAHRRCSNYTRTHFNREKNTDNAHRHTLRNASVKTSIKRWYRHWDAQM